MVRNECPWLLTPRQREVLEYYALGFTVKEISTRLGLQPRTVQLHLNGARKALNARNARHAVAIWYSLADVTFLLPKGLLEAFEEKPEGEERQ